MTKLSFAWLAANDDTDEEGFYFHGEDAYEVERAELKKLGAPDTAEIEFLSIEPEDRDNALVEAMVTPAFAKWARTNPETGEEVTEDENGNANLTFYNQGE